jgi:hypothetical protein
MNALLTKHGKSALDAMPSGFDADAVAGLSSVLTDLLADLLALYVKTKNFHWMSKVSRYSRRPMTSRSGSGRSAG